MKESLEGNHRPFDAKILHNNILSAVSNIVNQDIATVKGFSASQVSKMTTLASKIHAAAVTGKADKDLIIFFKSSLQKLIDNFVFTLKQIVPVILEKIRKVMLDTIFNFIEKSTGGIINSII